MARALTKADMAEKLHDELGLNKREAKELVEMLFEENEQKRDQSKRKKKMDKTERKKKERSEERREALQDDEQVKLSGFGNFDLRDKSERPGRNPKTGQEIPISARRVVTFKPGQKLKARVECYAGTEPEQ